MLNGKRAFHRESVVEVMHAILKDDIPELDGDGSKVTPALDKLMRRCLEKKPEHRFHSAHDLGFALKRCRFPLVRRVAASPPQQLQLFQKCQLPQREIIFHGSQLQRSR